MKIRLMFCVFGVMGICSIGCGGKSEIGPATTVPKVDPKKYEQEMQRSMEMNKVKGKMPELPAASGGKTDGK